MFVRWPSRRAFRSANHFKWVGLNTESSTHDNTEKPLDSSQNEALDKELCLLVDEKDHFLGSASKRDCHTVDPDGNVPLHRAFSVFLFNMRGDMLLQRRSDKKVTYPEYYTNACCSHPLFLDEKPEDVVAAAMRRLNHELGIAPPQMKPDMFTCMTRIHYQDAGNGVWGEHEIDYILFFQNDVKIHPNPNEVCEIAFIPKQVFDACIPKLQGPLTPWFNFVRQYKLKLWWDNLHRIKEFIEPHTIHKYSAIYRDA